MSAATATVYDVYLSHGPQDSGLAELVRQKLADVGLEVYDPKPKKFDAEFLTGLREPLAESRAVVILLTRSTLDSDRAVYEVGAAMALDKPVYVVYDGISLDEVPPVLRSQTVVRLSNLKKVARQIRAAETPLRDDEMAAVAAAYRELGLPVDAIITNPSASGRLVQSFRKATRKSLSSERLIRELARMRKRGELRPLAGKKAS
ncbi:MAG: toll/interleukin-1 receptor domain-containing protein [Planctomycetia bacterium]|nr:toll/interleukin-1 receptor domain-containing protein [Planctomycetia bacterium]